MARILKSPEDCADCLCRVCAHNANNDSWNSQLPYGYKGCTCDHCEIGTHQIVETTDDCPGFLPDEE